MRNTSMSDFAGSCLIVLVVSDNTTAKLAPKLMQALDFRARAQ